MAEAIQIKQVSYFPCRIIFLVEKKSRGLNYTQLKVCMIKRKSSFLQIGLFSVYVGWRTKSRTKIKIHIFDGN